MPPSESRLWRLSIDTGGTFTDALGIDPNGRRHTVKVLSSSAVRARVLTAGPKRLRLDVDPALPDGFFLGCSLGAAGADRRRHEVVASTGDGWLVLDGAGDRLAEGTTAELRFDLEAPILAAHWMTATPPGRPLPRIALRLATTRGTNALLERRGRPPVFFVTEGFSDLLRIGDQRRPDLFALAIVRPAPLYATVVEVPERLAADGSVVRSLDLERLTGPVERLIEGGATGAAIALVNSYRNAVHEEDLASFLRAAGFSHVSTSAALAPAIKILPRAETAVVDAYLSPIIGRYLGRVSSALPPGSTVHVMTSAGGLVRADGYRPKDSLLSGPAGGVVGAAAAGLSAGFERIIAFDMGGTSTDVSRVAGDFSYTFEQRVGDAVVAAPALAIETVAAGGGSMCQADGDRLRVGPESAGADPGPACYGAGGPLTITDVNVLLGRLDPEHFGIPIDPEAARRAFGTLRESLLGARARVGGDDALLAGCLAIANERMAEAIRRISVRRGFDPAGHALVAFGGAGGQHACAVAERLGIRSVLLPPAAGLLSAVGLGVAVLERFAARQVLQPLDACRDALRDWMDAVAAEALAALGDEGVPPARRQVRQRRVDLRLLGQETALEIDLGEGTATERAFADRYREIYGYSPPDRAIEVVALRAVASERRAAAATDPSPPSLPPAAPAGRRSAFLGGRWQEVRTYELPSLGPGDRFDGPALVFDAHATLVVEAGWSASVSCSGAVALERSGGRS